jgi:hypothetical protein
MGSVYTVAMPNTTIVADATLVIIHADSTYASRGGLLEILRCGVSQQAEETGQQLGIILGQKVTAFGTYTAATPVPHVLGGVASAITGGTAGAESTAGVDASAEGAGAVTPLIQDGFDNRNGWLYVPTPEERIIVGPDIAVVLKIVGTPTSLGNWNAFITFREVN